MQPAAPVVPKVIWMLWLQGWEKAPPVARASLASWQIRNPDWTVCSLSVADLDRYIPEDVLADILQAAKPPEAISDQVRFELLHRYGGVWADATTICASALDSWLPSNMASGFFAFANPGPDRMIATWFLAAGTGSYIASAWRLSSTKYWSGRTERDNYFWPHNLFAGLYTSDERFRAIWDAAPKISAAHPLHFGPNDPRLPNEVSDYYKSLLERPPVPVFKLTHKMAQPISRSSLMEVLCAFGQGTYRPEN